MKPVEILHPLYELQVGDHVLLYCPLGKNNSDNQQLEWYLNQKRIFNYDYNYEVRQNGLAIRNAQLFMSDFLFSCRTHLAHTYFPIRVFDPTTSYFYAKANYYNVTGKVGDTFLLDCYAVNKMQQKAPNKLLSIQFNWKKMSFNTQNTVVSSTNKMELVLSKESCGIYICEASNSTKKLFSRWFVSVNLE